MTASDQQKEGPPQLVAVIEIPAKGDVRIAIAQRSGITLTGALARAVLPDPEAASRVPGIM